MNRTPLAAVLFDTETTNMLSKEPGAPRPEVIELAWCEILEKTFERADYIHCDRFKPEGEISLGALSTHNILASDLKHCPSSSEATIPEALYIIGHNVDFDWEIMGKPQAKRICTLAMARRIWPDLDSHKLTALFYYIHGCNELTRDVVKNAHSALHDVAMTHQVLLHMTEKIGVKSLEDLYKFSEDARIPTHWTFGKHKGKKIQEADYGYVSWYRRQPEPDPYVLMAISRHFK
jgi:exodeoxyribonuclease X